MALAVRIRVNPALPTPIWSQIEESVRHLVASGALRPGDALPSVRDLAREQRINPNTVANAYQRLADAGVVEARRGEGTFVAERPPAMPPAPAAAASTVTISAMGTASGRHGWRPSCSCCSRLPPARSGATNASNASDCSASPTSIATASPYFL